MSAAMTMKLVRYLSFSAVVLLAACAWAQDAPPDTSAAPALDTAPPAPATDLDARDYISESDAGDKIAVTWALSPDDGGDQLPGRVGGARCRLLLRYRRL